MPINPANFLRKKYFLFICFFGFLMNPGSAFSIKKEKKYPVNFSIELPKETRDSSLLKRLSNALKFTANSRLKEQKRIIQLIDSLVIKNDKIATSKNIEELKAEINNKNKTNQTKYSELFELIQKLQKDLDAAQPTDADGDGRPEDALIQELVSKIIPILTSVKNNQNINAARQKRIKDVRSFYGNSSNPLDTVPNSDSTAIIYELKLKHLAKVIGFVNQTENSFANYNLKALSEVAIQAYQLEKDGHINQLNNSFNKKLIAELGRNNKPFYLGLFTKDLRTWETFLDQKKTQTAAIEEIISLLKDTKATGVNITLPQNNAVFKNKLLPFITLLSEQLKSSYPVYQLSLTLPGKTGANELDLKDFDAFVNLFIIDFCQPNHNLLGPIAPLTGASNNTIQASVSRMLNKNINPKKIIYALPYSGTKWSFDPQGQKTGRQQSLKYSTVRSSFTNSNYNLDTTVAFASRVTELGSDTVWYDDENTLSKKYDYILANQLGGVAICYLGYDNGHGELWDAITDKFVRIDSIKIATILNTQRPKDLTFFDKVSKYYFLFQQPCETKFDKEMLVRLGISERENQKLYDVTVSESKRVLFIANAVLGSILFICIIILIYFIKKEGEWWPWRKHLLGFIIFVVLLFILSVFLSIYLNDTIPWFGSSNKECINMPFHILLGIVTAGIILGVLIMRFLINPFLKQQEIP